MDYSYYIVLGSIKCKVSYLTYKSFKGVKEVS